ncbi:hypothetical protein D9758_011691 [Tetrapyrgos nigripes]|uniref:Uncharacterized protein n=1 Tax=Tetrapyrgos nigripes TaxID=182062 RepID=A0A8H5GD48_9AGAR|nr:hypothetical protein D9758_011691 [Tetrapyrgos nigripes]
MTVTSRSLLSLLTLPLILTLTSTSTSAFETIENPFVGGDSENGWTYLPPVPTADLYLDWPITGTDSVMPVYQSAGLDDSAITRAIIVPGGKPRDSWSYWITIKNILSYSAEIDPTINASTISIMSPVFLASVDVEAGAANATQLYWSKSGWFSGTYAQGPNANDKISSFQVLDDLVAHYADKERYPNIQEIIFAAHSAGSQFFQRYAALRIPTEDDSIIHYIPANPGSFVWLVEDRPAPNDTCADVDRYKYGLSSGFPGYSTGNVNEIGREGVVERFRSRNVHYAQGTADHGPGDTACEAVTQGSTHLERGENFVDMLNLNGGMPLNHTIDWVEGVSHQNDQMFNSTALRTRMFINATIPSTGLRPLRKREAKAKAAGHGFRQVRRRLN